MEIFQVLTGIDLMKMQEEQMGAKKRSDEDKKKSEEEMKKKEEEDKKKAEEDAFN